MGKPREQRDRNVREDGDDDDDDDDGFERFFGVLMLLSEHVGRVSGWTKREGCDDGVG
jgi:hypothetical protein